MSDFDKSDARKGLSIIVIVVSCMTIWAAAIAFLLQL